MRTGGAETAPLINYSASGKALAEKPKVAVARL